MESTLDNVFRSVLWASDEEPENLPHWIKFCSDLVAIGVPYNKIPAIVQAVKNA